MSYSLSKRMCPECGLDMLDTDHGALSRDDNETLVCSECGILQALRDYTKYADKRRSRIEETD